jgi:hypothetical protein
MNQRLTILAITVLGTIFGTASASADDSAFGKDLKVTIALQGQPCNEVTETKRNGDSDYNVACKDGNHYHVFVNAQGRVIVQKM